MGLYKTAPALSGRMCTLWCLASVKDAVIIEYGCMGHMAYARTFLHKMGVFGAKLYSTHISETDIAMGDTSRLEQTVKQVVEKEQVKTIFLLPSSVPEIIGVDLNAIAKELSHQFPDLQLIAFSNGGFDLDGYQGIERTLTLLAKSFFKEKQKTKKLTYNIIGSCADLFNFRPDCAETERILLGAFGAKPLCTMTSDTSVSELENMGSAHFNLVLRHEGEDAAKYLKEKFNIPYIIFRPYGVQQTVSALQQLAEELGMQPNASFLKKELEKTKIEIETMQKMIFYALKMHPEQANLCLVGHPDVVIGIAEYAKSFGFSKVDCYRDSCYTKNAELLFCSDKIKLELSEMQNTFLMAGGDLLRMANQSANLQIANPDSLWRSRYDAPLLGFRGAVNLATIWINELSKMH